MKIIRSYIKIRCIIDKLTKWNPERIIIGGGEPMIRLDFNEILVYLKERYDGR